MKLSSVRRALAAVVTAALVAAPLVVSAPADAGKPGRSGNPPAKPVTVMTRNLYLGADINRPVAAALAAAGARRHPAADPRRAGERDARDPGHRRRHRLHRPRGSVGRRDRGDRAGPDRAPGGRLVATRSPRAPEGRRGQRDRDRLRLPPDAARRARRVRGASTCRSASPPRADVEAPSFTGSPFDGTIGADARDVRLTMRDVVLMHVEDGLTALDEGQAVYDVNLEVAAAGQHDQLRPRVPVGRRPGRRAAVPVRQLPLRGVQLGHRLRAGRPAPGRGDGRGHHDGLRLRLQLRPAQQQHQAAGHAAAQGGVRADHRRRVTSPTSG